MDGVSFMKQTLCLIFALFLLLSIFTGCKKTPTDLSVPETTLAATKPTTYSASELTTPHNTTLVSQNHSFHFTDPDSSGNRTLFVNDSSTTQLIQTIPFFSHEWFSEYPLYWMDISFDGNNDIIVPYYRTAAKLYYKAYVWNKERGQYLYAPGFENIPNFALQEERKALLSYTVANNITVYSMYRFSEEKQDFVCWQTLYWEPAERAGSLCVTQLQYTDGVEKQVSRFLAAASDGFSEMDRTDPNILPYFQENSIWDLDNTWWQHPLQLADETVTLDPEPSKPENSTDVFTPVGLGNYFQIKGYTPPGKIGKLEYLFHEPMWNTDKEAPLIIFLHGLGDTVNQTSFGTATPLVHKLLALESQDEYYSTYTLVPMTPLKNEGWWQDWQLDFLKALIFQLVEDYDIDPKRIYITGISMGGYTTCDLVNQMPPDTFAAAVPLSGARYLLNPTQLFNTAFRIYHSKNDTVVNVSCSQGLAYQLESSQHPNVEYIEFADGDHISPLYSVYNDTAFFQWLFAQRLP